MLVSKFWRRKPGRWIYAVDFDGTLVENKYPMIGRHNRLAVWATNKLLSFGHAVIIWTCRQFPYPSQLGPAVGGVEQVRAWSADHLNSYVYVNENTTNNLQCFAGRDNRKVFANRYIDDRNPLWFDLIWLWVVFEGWMVWKGWIK